MISYQNKKTILIFGVSSFIGSNIAESLRDHYRVIGTFQNTSFSMAGVHSMKCNVLVKEEIAAIVSAYRPDVIIYCIGSASVELCHNYSKLADALNTVGLVNITRVSEKYGSKIFYFSSDFVFSGEDVLYSEKDSPLPTTMLGKTKLATEFYIQKSCLNYVILRCCPIYGRGYNPIIPTWFEILENNCNANKPSHFDEAIVSGFIDVAYLCMILKMCIEKDVTNRLLQVSSTNAMGRLQFARAFAEAFQKDVRLINKARWNFPQNEKLARQVDSFQFKMSMENLEDALNVFMPTIEESLDFSFARFGGIKMKHKGKKVMSGTIEFI